MKNSAIISIKLGVICIISALSLGFVNMITAPKIEQIKAERLQKALAEVSMGKQTGEYVAIDNYPGISGMYSLEGGGIILRVVAKGYGGDMMMLASFDLDGAVTAVKLMENQETPGLGKEAEKPSYMTRFLGTGSEQKPVPRFKSQLVQADADSVSGATITFSGIAAALEKGSLYVREGMK